MKQVSKDEFRAIYFQYAREADGWTQAYWDQLYAAERTPPMRYCVELPQRPDQVRMMIVADFAVREHRLFFVSEEAEERLFDSPGTSP